MNDRNTTVKKLLAFKEDPGLASFNELQNIANTMLLAAEKTHETNSVIKAMTEGLAASKLVGPPGPKGEDGHTPTEDELVEIIKSLIPDVKDGHTPTEDELVPIIKSLIPDPIPGPPGPPGKPGAPGRSPIPGVDFLLPKDGSPDSGEQIVEKINDLPTDTDEFKIDASHIKNLPKSEIKTIHKTIIKGGGGSSSGTSISLLYITVAASDTPSDIRATADYTCDGTADQVEIQQALDSGSRFVVLLEGTFNLTDRITVPSNVVFVGEKGSLITCGSNFISTATYRQTYLNNIGAGTVTQGQVFSLVVTAIGAENIILRGINVDGNGDAISNVLMANILIDQASGVVLEDCTSTNCALSINVNDANDGAFCLLFTTSEHCVVRGGSYTLSGYECIGIRDGSYDILVDGAYLGGAVVHVAQSEGNEEIGDVNNRSSHSTWQNCTFDQANFGSGYSHNGFMCHSATHVTVSNCRFLDASLAVICASSYINYTDNTITGSEGCIIVQEQAAWSAPYNINIVGNVCQETDSSSGNHPVTINGGKNINFSDNIINVIYQGKDGIICYDNDIDSITISNNIVRGADATNLPFNGINFNADGSKNVSIVGNQVMGSNSGIQINTTSSYILIDGNKCLTGCGKGIYITGGSTNNLVKNNNVVQCSSTKITAGSTDIVYDNLGLPSRGGFAKLTATGTVNSVNTAFTFTSKPLFVVSDGVWYEENNGWTWSGSTATLSVPPNDGVWGFV